jgi:hypothetical protein
MNQRATALKNFTDYLPTRPYCTDDPRLGQTVRGKDHAISYANIQPNTSGKVVWISFDVDHNDGATAWHRLSAPPPTLSIENPVNGHAHLLYALQAPVPRTDAARIKPMLYLAACQEGLRRKLRADPGYSGHLCKNPTHAKWNTQSYAGTYDLGDFAEWFDVPKPADMKKRVHDPDYAGLGRNCELYERLRVEAYHLVRKFWLPGGFEPFNEATRNRAEDINAQCFAESLPLSEVKGLAASVSRWVWKHFNPADFRAIQAKRGARKGAEKRAELLPQVLRLIGEGRSQREVAAFVGVDHKTVSNWLKLP